MKIIQLSDLHLTTPGRVLHGRDPLQHFQAAIADINTHQRDAALVVIPAIFPMMAARPR
ncbi:hypothetical protein [Candidatus Symbiopectobacterium sp. 'North America']|uniref:hypothetical protein n=1 Tax=Candidatus Symbiopectobacterium sp. 'North America' TaxID=2794574 RepID=UPI001FD33CC5|nr:hypothetical protein [Candidatus Symbiopectobacterium sp. 'North America']